MLQVQIKPKEKPYYYHFWLSLRQESQTWRINDNTATTN